MLILRGLLLALLLVCVAAGIIAGPARAADPPSIVLIVTDDQRWDTLWAMPTVRSKLADHGVTFTNAFVTNPLCCPSRATILTGGYSHDTGVYSNAAPFGGFFTFDDSSTIATWLQEHGYETGLVGKYMNAYLGSYIPPGWDHWAAFSGRAFSFDYTLNVNRELVEYGSEEADYATDVLAADAVSFIDETNGPLFLLFAPFAPHADTGWETIPAPRHSEAFTFLEPWRPPSYNEEDVSDKPRWIQERFLTLERQARGDNYRRTQLQSLLAVDEAVGAIVDALRRTERLDDALIVFTSDNGLSWGEHRWFRKIVPYEETIRVPLVIRHDPLVASSRRDDHMVLNVDLARTLAKVAGAKAPGARGRNLAPLLAGQGRPWRSDFLLESVRKPVAPYCGVRSARWTYVQYRNRFEELYDLAADPYQLENLAGAGHLRERLVASRERTIELCQPPPPGFRLQSPCLVRGNDKRDVLIGTRFYDLICGYGGNDRIFARAGNDEVIGGRDDDVILGGKGDDVLTGGPGDDSLYGGPGDDVIYARDGYRDLVACGPGDDIAYADHRDRVRGCETVRRRAP